MTHRFALAVVASLVAVTSCTPPRGPADPFSGGVSPSRQGVRQYIVRMEVGCDDCQVTYWVGAEQFGANAEQVWSERLNLTPLMPQAIRVLATPAENGRPIRWVRISVDGEVVAEATCENCDRTAQAIGQDRRTVTAETIIPPRR